MDRGASVLQATIAPAADGWRLDRALADALPTLSREVPGFLTFISSSPAETPNVFQVEQILYGLLIVVFLLFEPRGLFGIWVRFRTYWKSWPFSY